MTTNNSQAVEAAAFRKKPVTIHAVQWDGTYSHAKQLELQLGLDTRGMTSHPPSNTVSWWKIATLEDGHVVSPLDWIITGVKGEHYPCKPDIFEMTYERATLARPLEVAAPVGITRAEWIAQAKAFYVEAGDDDATARECARYICNQQDWAGGELGDPREEAQEDIHGRGRTGLAALAASRVPGASVAGPVAWFNSQTKDLILDLGDEGFKGYVPLYTHPTPEQGRAVDVGAVLDMSATNFACYMVDNCEREIVTEEAILRWLGMALCNPRYNATPAPDQATPLQPQDANDARRYLWLLPRLSGRAYREAGIIYSDGIDSISDAIDAAILATPATEQAAPVSVVGDSSILRALLVEWLDGMYDGPDFLRRVKLAVGDGLKLATKNGEPS